MSKITFSYKNFFKPTPKRILKLVNAIQSCCLMALGMSIYHNNETVVYIISTVSIVCHFISSCAGTKDG